MSTGLAEIDRATIRVLQRAGCDVVNSAGQGCCGALHAHGGDLDGALVLARRNVAAFARVEPAPIVVNSAGCGAMLKDYAHHLRHDPAWAEPLGPTHPRAYGTFPRVLGHYVRDEGVIPLEDAVRKMTSAIAARLGLRNRGLLREGMAADVVIFDPATIRENTTWQHPHQLATGIRDVWVNGARVLRDGAHTNATRGRFVKGPGAA